MLCFGGLSYTLQVKAIGYFGNMETSHLRENNFVTRYLFCLYSYQLIDGHVNKGM